MRSTAKYTLFTGFTAASIVLLLFQHYGVTANMMTLVLYLYAGTCLFGGIIGYRRARLKYRDNHDDPSLTTILGLSLPDWNKQSWTATIDGEERQLRSVRIIDNLVAVEHEGDDGVRKVSYPKKIVTALAKDQ